ncbi:MAG TPA: carboxypeptidase-like regulatory domain-containing protein [Planctomycetota bacterium]|nr:carboxypeptidase-like regulatory domain-containing protein [Planctomycetota bacterium]
MRYAKGYRHHIRIVLIVLSLPLLWYVMKGSLAYVAETPLYEGDRMESRPCRACGGRGRDPEFAIANPELGDRCLACAGKGTVEVVIPGPNRPTRFWGAVIDAGEVEELDLFPYPNLIRMLPIQVAFLPKDAGRIPGALGGARVDFTDSAGKRIEATTNATGRFSQLVPPGSYRIRIEAPGHDVFVHEEPFIVRTLTEPIWLEKAQILTEEMSSGEARGSYGLIFLAGVTKPGSESTGFVRVFGE